jgi:hypothetical protein
MVVAWQPLSTSFKLGKSVGRLRTRTVYGLRLRALLVSVYRHGTPCSFIDIEEYHNKILIS